MRKFVSLIGAGALLLSLVPAALAASPVVGPSKSSGTIVSIAVANGNFTTLVAAVGCADPAVANALTSGRQLTRLCPDRRGIPRVALRAAHGRQHLHAFHRAC